MAPTLRRRSALPPKSTPKTRQSKTKRQSDAVIKRVRTKKKAPRKERDQTEPPLSPPVSPSAWRVPKNPQATLLGLPAKISRLELRLQIYDYLRDSVLLHVHYREPHNKYEDGKLQPGRFIWTPCRALNPTNPLLCANPKWSSMCSESDRCTYQIPGPPPTPLGLLALTYTCRLLRSETHDMVHQNATYSLSAQYLPLWLKHLHEHAPQQLKNLRRVTLTGRNKYICSNERWLAEQLQDQVPQLEGVAYQGQVDPIWVFGYAARDGQRPICLRSRIAQAMKSFSPKITVAIEGHAWYKGRDYGYVWESDRQGTFRILRKGKPGNDINGGTGWEPHDVEVEMHNVFF